MRAGTPRRWAAVALAVIGLALVAMPVVFDVFSRAPKGAQMIDAFAPFMTSSRLDGYHADMSAIGAAVKDAPQVAERLFGTPAGSAQPRLAAAYPSFTLFPWFFVAPGVIILALIALGLTCPAWWRRLSWALAALGVALVLAPAVFQMFSRALDGGRMMTAFKPIETRARVARIQGYFSDIAAGQGAVQLELIPALRRAGLSATEISASYPGLTRFDGDWIHILNDMTPLIGAMSNNVVNYDAVAALPPFALFPWFFVLPGLLVAGLGLAAVPRRSRDTDGAASTDIPHPITEGVT
jgi:hypothetical protein